MKETKERGIYMGFETISAKDLDRYIGIPNVIIIDLRQCEEFNEKHLSGAVNIPYENLEKSSAHFSRRNWYILYCERGSVSLIAAKELSEKGFLVKTVIGGIHSYRGNNIVK